MAKKVLECRSLIPDSSCTLFLIGEVDEVAQAFADHVARGHPERQADFSRPVIEYQLQKAIFVSRERAYIGDEYELVDDDRTIRIPGRGFVIQRFAQVARDGEDGGDDGEGVAAGATVHLECACQFGNPGERACKIKLEGTTAICVKDTCLQCGWSTTIPTVAGIGDAIIVSEFD